MKREDVLKAFAELSPEDQEAIGAELTGKGTSQGTGDPMAMCQEMMEKMKAGGDPMAMWQEMMEKMKVGGNPMAVCEEIKEKIKGKCC